jgi:hypothetical protein
VTDQLIKATLDVLIAIEPDYKQLLGEPGLNDEATEEYQIALIAVLLLWITRNKKLKLDDQFAVTAALGELQVALEELGLQQLPEAFVLGAETGAQAGAVSGVAALQPGEVIELGGAINTNQQFIDGSLIPYMQEELAKAKPGTTLGQLAAERQFAWETRTGLYAGAYWNAIWTGLGEILGERLLRDTQPVQRLLDPAAEHCGTCPGKAMEYGSWNEMLAFTGGLPADGSDDCHSNCRCQIEIFQNGEWIPAGI